MHVTHTTELQCTPERLWLFLDEPERQKLWLKGLQKMSRTSDGPPRPGSTFRMQIKEGGRVQDYDGEVTAYDPPRHLGIRFRGGAFGSGMAMRVDYRLTSLEGRTRLDYECRMEAGKLPFFFRLLMPLIKLFGKWQLRGFLKTLKRLAEAPDAQPATPAGAVL